MMIASDPSHPHLPCQECISLQVGAGISFHSKFYSFYREMRRIVASYVDKKIVAPSAELHLAVEAKGK